MTEDVFSTLACQKTPVVLYGTGNGADKIFAVLQSHDIPVQDIYVSDDFARGQSFHGYSVKPLSELSSVNMPLTVCIAFGTSRPEVLARMEQLARSYDTVCPDVPLFGDTLFTAKLFEENRSSIDAARAVLFDNRSKEVFDDILQYRFSGRLQPLLRAVTEHWSVDRSLVASVSPKTFVDCGAFRGDTVEAAVKVFPTIKTAYAMEPDPHSFRALTAFSEVCSITCHPIEAAAWDTDTVLSFVKGGGRSATLTAVKGKILPNGGHYCNVKARKVDTVLSGVNPDLIKYDVEGAEYEALCGSRKTISASRPALVVALYHRTEDLWRLPLFLKKTFPGYRYYLGRERSIPAWDMNLICIPEER